MASDRTLTPFYHFEAFRGAADGYSTQQLATIARHPQITALSYAVTTLVSSFLRKPPWSFPLANPLPRPTTTCLAC